MAAAQQKAAAPAAVTTHLNSSQEVLAGLGVVLALVSDHLAALDLGSKPRLDAQDMSAIVRLARRAVQVAEEDAEELFDRLECWRLH